MLRLQRLLPNGYRSHQADKQVDFANSYGTHMLSQPDLTDTCSQINSGPGKDTADMVDKHEAARR